MIERGLYSSLTAIIVFRSRTAVFAASPGNTCYSAEEKIFPGQGTNADPPAPFRGEKGEEKIVSEKTLQCLESSKWPSFGGVAW